MIRDIDTIIQNIYKAGYEGQPKDIVFKNSKLALVEVFKEYIEEKKPPNIEYRSLSGTGWNAALIEYEKSLLEGLEKENEV